MTRLFHQGSPEEQIIEVWRERHQILYQLNLDLRDEIAQLREQLNALEQRFHNLEPDADQLKP